MEMFKYRETLEICTLNSEKKKEKSAAYSWKVQNKEALKKEL